MKKVLYIDAWTKAKKPHSQQNICQARNIHRTTVKKEEKTITTKIATKKQQKNNNKTKTNKKINN